MFDIGFAELVLIAIVALLVIGPERLPRVAKSAGLWVGKMRGFVSSVQSDINQELKADELKKIMAEQAESSGVHEIIEDVKQASEKLTDDLNEVGDEVQKQDYALRAIVDEKPGDWDGDDDGADPASNEPPQIEKQEDQK